MKRGEKETAPRNTIVGSRAICQKVYRDEVGNRRWATSGAKKWVTFSSGFRSVCGSGKRHPRHGHRVASGDCDDYLFNVPRVFHRSARQRGSTRQCIRVCLSAFFFFLRSVSVHFFPNTFSLIYLFSSFVSVHFFSVLLKAC